MVTAFCRRQRSRLVSLVHMVFHLFASPRKMGGSQHFDGRVLTTGSTRADPNAAALAAAVQAQICEQMQLDDCSQVQIQGLVSPTGQFGSGGEVQGGFNVDLSSEYQAALSSADADGDGNLSPAEIAADPNAAALVAAMQQSICDTLTTCTDPSTIAISQIANVAGGGGGTLEDPDGGGSISHAMGLSVSDEFHAHLMEADTNGDGLLEPDEMAAHPTAAAIVEAMQTSICDSIPACTDPTTISIDGITSGDAAGRRRALLGGNDQLASVTLAQPTVQTFGTMSAFRDCVLSQTEIADNRAATSFANAFGRAQGTPVTALRVPGCTTARGKIGQKLTSDRRVTMGWDQWAAMGGNQLPMTPEMIKANSEATALAQDFVTAGCTEFALAAEQCPSVAVADLYPVLQPDGSVEVRAALSGHRGQLLLLASVEEPDEAGR